MTKRSILTTAFAYFKKGYRAEETNCSPQGQTV